MSVVDYFVISCIRRVYLFIGPSRNKRGETRILPGTCVTCAAFPYFDRDWYVATARNTILLNLHSNANIDLRHYEHCNIPAMELSQAWNMALFNFRIVFRIRYSTKFVAPEFIGRLRAPTRSDMCVNTEIYTHRTETNLYNPTHPTRWVSRDLPPTHNYVALQFRWCISMYRRRECFPLWIHE